MQQKQLVVCMTGFVNDNNTPNYEKMISSLGCKYIETLSYGTDILIVNKTSTEKYQIAQLPNSKVQSVTIQWLENSYEKMEVQPTTDYVIPKIFYGVKVGIAGFQQEKYDRLHKILIENGGTVQKIEMNSSIKQLPDVIITNKHYLRKVQIYICRFQTPIVQIQWLQQSLKHKICKYPTNYALNYENIPTHSPIHNIKRLNRKLTSCLQIKSLALPNLLLNDQSLIFLDSNSLEKQLQSILKKLICINGGMYLEFVNPAVTHILVGNLTEKQYGIIMNEAGSTSILRVEWLIDSILFGCKMSESDYKVRSFKGKFKDRDQIQLILNNNSQSLGLHRQNSFNNSNRQSLSGLNLSIDAPRQVPIVKKKAIKTQIFKNKTFFIEYNQRKQSQLMNIPTKIKQNGGTVYDGPKKNNKNYLVMKDSIHNKQIIMEYCGKYKCQIIPVSIRWVDYCVRKSMFIQNDLENFLIFKPFNFKTPITQFMTMRISILGVDDIFKERLRELLESLGNLKSKPNKSELTHCLCGRTIKNKFSKFADKIKEIRKQNNRVKFIKYQWLIDIVNNNGTILPTQPYEIQTQDPAKYIEDTAEKDGLTDDIKTPEKIIQAHEQ